MIAVTKHNGNIVPLQLFTNVEGNIKTEDNYQPVYNIGGEILRVPVDGLLVNMDNIVFSQNKLLNTCRNRENIFYIGSNKQSTLGNISNPSNGQTGVDTTEKHWLYNKVASARLNFESGTFTDELTFYITLKHSVDQTDPSYIFYLNSGKHARLGGGTNNVYDFFVSSTEGSVNPASAYASTSNSDKKNYFNITLTLQGGNQVNLYENGNKLNSNVLTFSNFITNLTNIYILGRLTDKTGGVFKVKTLRIWNKTITEDNMRDMLKIDKII